MFTIRGGKSGGCALQRSLCFAIRLRIWTKPIQMLVKVTALRPRSASDMDPFRKCFHQRCHLRVHSSGLMTKLNLQNLQPRFNKKDQPSIQGRVIGHDAFLLVCNKGEAQMRLVGSAPLRFNHFIKQFKFVITLQVAAISEASRSRSGPPFPRREEGVCH